MKRDQLCGTVYYKFQRLSFFDMPRFPLVFPFVLLATSKKNVDVPNVFLWFPMTVDGYLFSDMPRFPLVRPYLFLATSQKRCFPNGFPRFFNNPRRLSFSCHAGKGISNGLTGKYLFSKSFPRIPKWFPWFGRARRILVFPLPPAKRLFPNGFLRFPDNCRRL